MEWLKLLFTTLGGGLLTFIGSILYFRPKLKQAKAEAKMKEAETQNFIYDSLVSRLNQMEKMYNEQYASQNEVIKELRQEVLKLSEEKFANEKRIIQLEDENRVLKEKVEQLESAYKSIPKSGENH